MEANTWQDAILPIDKLKELIVISLSKNTWFGSDIAKEQAEIAFKAGEKAMLAKLRRALAGEPVAFDYALDVIEIQWLYEKSRINF